MIHVITFFRYERRPKLAFKGVVDKDQTRRSVFSYLLCRPTVSQYVVLARTSHKKKEEKC